MEYLKDNYDCISIEDALGRDKRPKQHQSAVITFDDGYANNLEIALPVLEDLGIPAIIYVTSRHVCERRLFWPDKIWLAAKRSAVSKIDLSGLAESIGVYDLGGSGEQWQENVLRILEDVKKTDPSRREEIADEIVTRFGNSHEAKPFDIKVEDNVFTPLTQEQVSKLAAHPLITIGAHSHCHNLLDQLPLPQAEESILESRGILEKLTGKKIEHFSYPNGNYTTDIIDIVQNAGFRSAVTVQPGFYKNGDDPYRIRRFGVGAHMSIDLFKAKLTGIFELAKRFGL